MRLEFLTESESGTYGAKKGDLLDDLRLSEGRTLLAHYSRLYSDKRVVYKILTLVSKSPKQANLLESVALAIELRAHMLIPPQVYHEPICLLVGLRLDVRCDLRARQNEKGLGGLAIYKPGNEDMRGCCYCN